MTCKSRTFNLDLNLDIHIIFSSSPNGNLEHKFFLCFCNTDVFFYSWTRSGAWGHGHLKNVARKLTAGLNWSTTTGRHCHLETGYLENAVPCEMNMSNKHIIISCIYCMIILMVAIEKHIRSTTSARNHRHHQHHKKLTYTDWFILNYFIFYFLRVSKYNIII